MTTQQEVLSQLQSDLLETPDGGLTATTPLWTPEEWLGALNDYQRRLLEQSGLVVSVVTASASGGVAIVALPISVALIIRAVWVTHDGAVTRLEALGPFEIDLMQAMLPQGRSKPLYYVLSAVPARQLRLVPVPRDVGQVQLLVVESGTVAAASPAAELTVPTDWSDYVRYGAETDLLLKTGPARDVARGMYARERFEEGTRLGRLLLDELAAGMTGAMGTFGGGNG